MAAIGSIRADNSISLGDEDFSSKSSPFTRLPPGFLPFEEFQRQFSLGNASTEKLHPHTKSLSRILQKDLIQGLELLLDADQAVVEGLERFLPEIGPLSADLSDRLQKGGRIFLVGSGSSGRIAIDLAAKCAAAVPKSKGKIRGVIAGGDGAVIRAKEGFEDSEKEGEKVLEGFRLQPEDTVMLISSSGSSTFNAGCGHFAANLGSRVLYFYNSKEIPARTQKLFERTNNPAIPLELDIGPQAIAGSARLQGASIALVCLGALLEKALSPESKSLDELPQKLRQGTSLVRGHLNEIAELVRKETAVFSNPNSNFYRLKDETSEGYVTFIGQSDSIRDILIDATESSPTFSTNPIRRAGEEHLKKEEFRAYLADQKENRKAWETLLGREADRDTDAFDLDSEEIDSRIGKGNLLIGVAKLPDGKEIPSSLSKIVEKAASNETETGWVVISRGGLSSQIDGVSIGNIPSDPLGIVETFVLKQILNSISNGSMILMNKIYGNQMVDVRPSNGKLIDRCCRLVKEIWSESGRPLKWTERELYHAIAHISALKKEFTEKGQYAPSVVKIVLALLHLQKDPKDESIRQAVDFLAERGEKLDFLESGYTLCIDGGGSKTELQILDSQGRPVPFLKNGQIVQSYQAGPSNINVIRKEGVKAVLDDLFQDLQIDGENLQDILPRSRIIAGMAGVAQPQNNAAVASLFEEWGIDKKALILQNDAELALKLLHGNGIVLVSGTGSVCFAEKNGVRYRVGGLGTILGDEGSCYQMGLQAIQACLKEEFGYGPATQLSPVLQKHFGVSELKTFVPKINSGEMTPAEIASAAPLVFENAAQGDPAAKAVLSRIAGDLREMVSTALKISALSNCELHAWGGLFKGDSSDLLLKKIQEDPFIEWRNIQIVNQSNQNVAVAYAKIMGE